MKNVKYINCFHLRSHWRKNMLIVIVFVAVSTIMLLVNRNDYVCDFDKHLLGRQEGRLLS